jgi:DNA polymerase-3 subunit alpha
MIPLAEKLGDKLVTGVRLTLVNEATQEKKQPFWQPKVYPKTEGAMQLVYKYLSRSFERPYFYEQPRLDFNSFYEMLREGGSDFLFSTGDLNSVILHPNHTDILDTIASLVGDVNLVYDICPMNSARYDRINYTSLLYCKEANGVNIYIPALYLKDNADVFPIHYSIYKNVEFNFLKPNHTDFFFEPNKNIKMFAAMFERLKTRYNFKPTIKYRRETFAFPTYKWQEQKPRLPQLSANPAATLKKLAIEGFKDRLTKNIYGYKPSMEQLKNDYVPRLNFELDTLVTLGFADYFLLVYELTDWCQKQNIKIGPGRGSVGGSLVAFCMGITDVDPLRFDLVFERFINPTRIDLPDIDLDFMSTRRHEIVEHLIDRYGSDNVAGIINYSKLQSKSALRSTCRILGLPDNEYACSTLIPSNFGFSDPLEEAEKKVIDIKNFAKNHPDAWGKALKVEGKMRNFSAHAAGIIVSNRPLVQDAVIEVRKENRIVNWDKKLCEKQGLVKLDVLGLKTLDVMDLALQYIKRDKGLDIDLRKIELNDPKVLDNFAKGNTGGVFQFEGGSVRKLLKELSKSENLHFDDLVAANALNRPGPIEAGLVQMYIDGKNGDLHDVDHESMAEILKPTYNVMVYQEQIMRVAVEFAGYTLPEADNLRKIMGKKLPEEMKKEAGKFVEGAVKTHGVPAALPERVFDQISKFAFYAFNKSHSVEYSLLSYICMWLKVYHPAQFYAATLTYMDDKKVRTVINEAAKSGITVDAPSINHSTDKFNCVTSRRIVAPLSKIKYVSGGASHIMLERETNGPYKSITDLQDRTISRLVTSRTIKAMLAIGCLDEIAPPTGPIDLTERSKAINEYLPSIPLGHVHIKRKMDTSKASIQKLLELIGTLKDDNPELVKPFLGQRAKFMVCFDNATTTEAKNGVFTESKGFNSVALSMYKEGMEKADAYWTGLVKRPKAKSEKIFNNTVLEESYKILREEIDILKPTVILCLGSAVSKCFDPSLKGGAMDNAGKILYNAELDCNIMFGINPAQLFFNPDYAETLNELFETVSTMI